MNYKPTPLRNKFKTRSKGCRTATKRKWWVKHDIHSAVEWLLSTRREDGNGISVVNVCDVFRAFEDVMNTKPKEAVE